LGLNSYLWEALTAGLGGLPSVALLTPTARFGLVYLHGICHNVPEAGGSRKMKFFITISQDEDGMFIAECPSIPGCISQGSTAREAEKNIQQAIKECLEVRAAKGMPLTVAIRQIEVRL
jgi:predicted RNase H-like HicB family nuclease